MACSDGAKSMSESLLVIDGISRHFGGVTALAEVSFSVAALASPPPLLQVAPAYIEIDDGPVYVVAGFQAAIV